MIPPDKVLDGLDKRFTEFQQIFGVQRLGGFGSVARDPLVFLDNMLTAVERIESYTDGFSPDSLNDPRTLEAVVRNLEVLGEASKSIPDRTREKNPDIRMA